MKRKIIAAGGIVINAKNEILMNLMTEIASDEEKIEYKKNSIKFLPIQNDLEDNAKTNKLSEASD